VGIISFSGAGAIMALDACQDYGLEVVELETETLRKLSDLAPPWLRVGNPVDIWPTIMMQKGRLMDLIQGGLEILLADRRVHAALFIGPAFSTPGGHGSWDLSGPLLAAAEKFNDKPIVCWLYGTYFQEMAQVLEGHGGVVAFPTCDRAIRALARRQEYLEGLKRDS
jgi:acetyltransferase